jgi:hypothetical protein
MVKLTKVYVMPEPLGKPADVGFPSVAGSQPFDCRYSYYFEADGFLMKAGSAVMEQEKQTIAAMTAGTQIQLKGLMEEVTSTSTAQFDDYLMYLRGIGTDYYDMIPRDVREYIKRLRKGENDESHWLYFYAPYHWIPWELIFDGDGFWGDKYVISRIPVLSFEAGQSRNIVDSTPIGVSSMLNVVGDKVLDYLPDDDFPRLILSPVCSSIPTECNLGNNGWAPKGISEIKKGIETASIIHFTCHGSFDDEAGYYLQLNSSSPQVHKYRLYGSLLRQCYVDNALVFVNACASDVPSLKLGSFINLGHEFFECGADVFIGTIAPVPIRRAVTLAAIFYEHLADGESVGTALHKAKSTMKKEENPFWLFYCLYGNAFMRFSWPLAYKPT